MTCAWDAVPLHFVDFEGSLASGVLEYGIVTLRGGVILHTHTRLCGATGRVRPEDIAVHGLDAAAVASALPLSEDWDLFVRLRTTGPLAAHYAQAENSLLKGVWPHPRLVPDFARGGGGDSNEWGPWVDTGRLYPQLHPELGSGKLADLVAACGLQAELDSHAIRHCPPGRRHFHAALYDALAGALLLLRLRHDPRVAAWSLAQLLVESTLDPAKREALTQGELF